MTRRQDRRCRQGAGSRVVTNKDLESVLDTSDEWISTRTGIKERRFVAEGENAATLAIDASEEALEHAGVNGRSVDLVICGTSTAPESMPSVACLVGEEIGAPGAVRWTWPPRAPGTPTLPPWHRP